MNYMVYIDPSVMIELYNEAMLPPHWSNKEGFFKKFIDDQAYMWRYMHKVPREDAEVTIDEQIEQL